MCVRASTTTEGVPKDSSENHPRAGEEVLRQTGSIHRSTKDPSQGEEKRSLKTEAA